MYVKTKVRTEISFKVSVTIFLKKNISGRLKKVKFILILYDGSTNRRVIGREVVYAK